MMRYFKIYVSAYIYLFCVACGAQNKAADNDQPKKQLEISFTHNQTGDFNVVVFRKTKLGSTAELYLKIANTSSALSREGSEFKLVLDSAVSKNLNSGDCLSVAIEKSVAERSENSAESCL